MNDTISPKGGTIRTEQEERIKNLFTAKREITPQSVKALRSSRETQAIQQRRTRNDS